MAFDCYLTIEGVEGETTTSVHPGAMEVLAYSHGLAHTAGLIRGANGGVNSIAAHKDLVIVKSVDKATPNLAMACSSGTRYPRATLEACRASGYGDGSIETYWTIELEDVYIRSINFSASPSDHFPQESVALAYSAITWTYFLTDHHTGQPRGQNTATVSLADGS